MADILWNGVGPWHRTAYGGLTKIFVPLLKAAGHRVVIAVMGKPGLNEGHPDYRVPWNGTEVLKMDPRRRGRVDDEFGLPRPADIRGAFGGKDPDLIIVLKDAWVLTPAEYKPYNTAVWTNIDCDPMGAPDRQFFEASGATPIAVSRHGERMMRGAGLAPLYVPHGIELADWGPAEDKAEVRRFLDLPEDVFIAGIDAQNTSIRKAFAEQLEGFAQFHAKHPRSMLLCHSNAEHPKGMNLRHLAFALGLVKSDVAPPSPDDAVWFGAHMVQKTGQMRRWYQVLDVFMNATYGEGYAMGVVQALACGVPVIGTRGTAVTEKVPPGAGWLAGGQRLWVPPMRAWWTIPSVGQISAALEKAWRNRGQGSAVGMNVAAQYDADLITREHWKRAIDDLIT